MKKHESEQTELKISEAEWAVLDVLWERGAVSASQATTSLSSKTGWRLRTVRSFWGRLIGKGAVRLLDDEPIYRYEAICEREAIIRQESSGFLEKYFGGTFHAMIAHYLKNEKITPEEIERLKQMLDEHENQNPSNNKT